MSFNSSILHLEISIRLQGSSVPNAGRIEVLYAGVWGGINSDGFSYRSWTINEATVACRQLGYQAGAEAALANGVYGPVNGPVWLSSLHCYGNETNLMSCSHDGLGNKSELLRHERVAGVICKDLSFPSGMFSDKECVIDLLMCSYILKWLALPFLSLFKSILTNGNISRYIRILKEEL